MISEPEKKGINKSERGERGGTTTTTGVNCSAFGALQKLIGNRYNYPPDALCVVSLDILRLSNSQ